MSEKNSKIHYIESYKKKSNNQSRIKAECSNHTTKGMTDTDSGTRMGGQKLKNVIQSVKIQQARAMTLMSNSLKVRLESQKLMYNC